MNGRRVGCAVVFALMVGLGADRDPADGTLSVGVARVDITPDGPIRLSGYNARKTVSAGVDQAIWAKALAIGAPGEPTSVLVSVDNLGVPAPVVEAVAARLEEKAAIARANLAVASSHTHSAPCLTGAAPNIFGMKLPDDEQAAIDRYTGRLTDRLEEVALAAVRDRRPGRLAWGAGRVGFAANRRTPGGPVDHALPMLRVTDEAGAIRAVVVGYACHCTTLDPADNRVHGDWAGEAQAAIERDHPGALAMTIIGCGADANPIDRPGRAVARRHGRAIADEVNRLLKTPLRPLARAPVARLRRIALDFDSLPTRSELEALVKKGGPAGYNASTQLARLDRGEPLQSALSYPVQTWQFGDDLVMVYLAGEVVVDYALRLKRELDPDRLWIVAYANDLPCYIPSERILREGGYEGGGAMVYYGKPTRLRPGIEDRIVGAVRDLVPREFQGDPQRSGP